MSTQLAGPGMPEIMGLDVDMSLPMPTFEQVRAFLRDQYVHSRLEGCGADYADVVTNSYVADLEADGYGGISHFESRLGKYFLFDRSLRILNPDAPPKEIQATAGNLTHIYGGGW